MSKILRLLHLRRLELPQRRMSRTRTGSSMRRISMTTTTTTRVQRRNLTTATQETNTPVYFGVGNNRFRSCLNCIPVTLEHGLPGAASGPADQPTMCSEGRLHVGFMARLNKLPTNDVITLYFRFRAVDTDFEAAASIPRVQGCRGLY